MIIPAQDNILPVGICQWTAVMVDMRLAERHGYVVNEKKKKKAASCTFIMFSQDIYIPCFEARKNGVAEEQLILPRLF